jgi:hypothetical protein
MGSIMAAERHESAESSAAALLEKYAQTLLRTGAVTCNGFPADDGDLIVVEEGWERRCVWRAMPHS